MDAQAEILKRATAGRVTRSVPTIPVTLTNEDTALFKDDESFGNVCVWRGYTALPILYARIQPGECDAARVLAEIAQIKEVRDAMIEVTASFLKDVPNGEEAGAFLRANAHLLEFKMLAFDDVEDGRVVTKEMEHIYAEACFIPWLVETCQDPCITHMFEALLYGASKIEEKGERLSLLVAEPSSLRLRTKPTRLLVAEALRSEPDFSGYTELPKLRGLVSDDDYELIEAFLEQLADSGRTLVPLVFALMRIMFVQLTICQFDAETNQECIDEYICAIEDILRHESVRDAQDEIDEFAHMTGVEKTGLDWVFKPDEAAQQREEDNCECDDSSAQRVAKKPRLFALVGL
jgi:hypothetical protein